MSSNTSRKARRIFDGTGVYIALFLVVTALAVAGYWTLIPHSPAETPAVEETVPAPLPPAPSYAAVQKEEKKPEPPAEPELTPEEQAAPAQSAVTVELPPTEPVDLTPAPPSLVVAPLVGETVAAFSMEQLAYSETLGDWRTHNGVDIAAPLGTKVCAASAGTVSDVRDDDLMGTTVVIAHDDGCDTVYANLQATPTVNVGEHVTAGQVIGSVGKTALSESALPTHLHFAVTRDGEFIDPAEYVK